MITATHSFEIELDVSGAVTPGYDGDATCPPHGPDVEDVEITGVFALIRAPYVPGKAPGWNRTDLLAGVDVKNPEVQKILANMLAFSGEDVTDAILEAAS